MSSPINELTGTLADLKGLGELVKDVRGQLQNDITEATQKVQLVKSGIADPLRDAVKSLDGFLVGITNGTPDGA